MPAVAEQLADVVVPDIIDSETPPRLCCARIAHGVWCQLDDAHDGDHASDVAPTFGPIAREPELCRRHRGLQR